MNTKTTEKEKNGKTMVFLGAVFVGMMFVGMMFVSSYLADNDIISSTGFVASIIILIVALIISIIFLWKR